MTHAKDIQVVPYDINWPQLFQIEAAIIKEALGGNCISVHHIGSTAVPALAAKPKIDIIASVANGEESVYCLESIGFTHKGEWNIPFKYGFTKRGETDFNLHVYEEDHPEIELNLVFRDYLRRNIEVRNEYAALKYNTLQHQSSFQKNNSIFTGYNLAKDGLIRDVLNKSGFNRLRFLKCTHYAEWDAVKNLRKQYFANITSGNDPCEWTFNHQDHEHLILCQGTRVVAYAHLQTLSNIQVILKILVADDTKRSDYAKQLHTLIEKWLTKHNRSIVGIAS